MKKVELADYELTFSDGLTKVIKGVGDYYFGECWVEFWDNTRRKGNIIAIFKTTNVAACQMIK